MASDFIKSYADKPEVIDEGIMLYPKLLEPDNYMGKERYKMHQLYPATKEGQPRKLIAMVDRLAKAQWNIGARELDQTPWSNGDELADRHDKKNGKLDPDAVGGKDYLRGYTRVSMGSKDKPLFLSHRKNPKTGKRDITLNDEEAKNLIYSGARCIPMVEGATFVGDEGAGVTLFLVAVMLIPGGAKLDLPDSGGARDISAFDEVEIDDDMGDDMGADDDDAPFDSLGL